MRFFIPLGPRILDLRVKLLRVCILYLVRIPMSRELTVDKLVAREYGDEFDTMVRIAILFALLFCL